MTTAKFVWPTGEDYDLSMQNLSMMALDQDIRVGQVEMDKEGFGIRRFGGAGLYTTTYKVTMPVSAHKSSTGPSHGWMVRCFCTTDIGGKPPADIADRYKHISAFCLDHYARVSALLPVTYVEQGINVLYLDENQNTASRTATLPIVKMPFIHAPSLGNFVAINHKKPKVMEQLCVAWLEMIRELERIQMAHGDLDLTNVLVIEKGGKLILKLIDYDDVWIPALAGRKQIERGHEGFQHPIYERPYNAEMDRFSAFAMYISLRALSFYPDLYTKYGADDTHRLLFSEQDYRRECDASRGGNAPNHIAQLRAQLLEEGKDELTPYLDQLCYALHNKCMPLYTLDTVPLPPPEPTDLTEYRWNTSAWIAIAIIVAVIVMLIILTIILVNVHRQMGPINGMQIAMYLSHQNIVHAYPRASS